MVTASPRIPASQPDTDRVVLTPVEAARILGLGQTELYLKLQNGTTPFPARKLGRKWVIPARPFYAWLEGDSGQTDAA